MTLKREASTNRIDQNRRCSESLYRKIISDDQDVENKTSKEVNSEGQLVDSMENDKTKKILVSGGIKPMFKGKPQSRVSWDYSSGVARLTKEILRSNIPENMPSGTLISISRSLQNQISKELSLSCVKLLNKQP